MRIAAIGAHPDDAEIFMGGALLAWRALGADVDVVVLTDGSRGGTGDPAALAATRRTEAEAAAAVLGATVRFLGFPDGALANDGPTVAAVRDLLATLAPDLAVTHAPGDYHADHRAASAIVGQAAGFAVPVLWCDTMMGTGFEPTHYVDVTDHFAAKCEAIRRHRSQDPGRFVDLARLQNGFRGGQCGHPGTRLAEAYRFEPRYPFADVRDLLPPAPPLRPVPARDRAAVPEG